MDELIGKRPTARIAHRRVIGSLLIILAAVPSGCRDDPPRPAGAAPSTVSPESAPQPAQISPAAIDAAITAFLDAWKIGDRRTMLRFAEAELVDNFVHENRHAETYSYRWNDHCALKVTGAGSCEFLIGDPRYPWGLIFRLSYTAQDAGILIYEISFQGDAG
ncbi:hypothetical protein KBX08_32475 [Micromonospora sp. H61]|uniref:hypothetical protein n=1 Tax=Micromonospora sp. H61 TaxID=2824888 RepID=UPI001B3994FA|nr:hypothetical protein [Micromonospora sp. H61]MBQ0994777.1 hypothetical protein [Micromonospora sp. H61]